MSFLGDIMLDRGVQNSVIRNMGGDYAKLLAKNVEEPFLKPKGFEVVQDIGDDRVRRTKTTAEQQVLREQEEEAETLYYIYVVDRSEHLRGVFSLRELVMSAPDRKVREFMTENPVSVRPEASEEEITEVIAKYNLLALPVVDQEGELHGIITIDDAIDLVLPLAWKKRLPRIFH